MNRQNGRLVPESSMGKDAFCKRLIALAGLHSSKRNLIFDLPAIEQSGGTSPTYDKLRANLLPELFQRLSDLRVVLSGAG